ncbi:hypothetical protein [Xanthomonas albilineans]|nr:hypothetical protein [Xanthomonas albilineans]QHQ29239.1 hypothetical protein XaFJ1_GM002526 [Xanthomonas albilineans]
MTAVDDYSDGGGADQALDGRRKLAVVAELLQGKARLVQASGGSI